MGDNLPVDIMLYGVYMMPLKFTILTVLCLVFWVSSLFGVGFLYSVMCLSIHSAINLLEFKIVFNSWLKSPCHLLLGHQGSKLLEDLLHDG